MGRLRNFINVADEKALDVSKTNLEASFVASKGSLDEAIKVSMNRICARFKNDYIIDPERTKVLINSIEKEGLLQPIVLMNIKDYINTNKLLPDEISYYQEKLHKGFDFFIVAGHRRFRAYASLLSNAIIETNEQLEQFYTDIKDPNTELGLKFTVSIGKKTEEKWVNILAIVANPENIDEVLAYLHSNITARVPSQYEIVTSVIDQLKRNGDLDETLELYRKSSRDTIVVLLMRYIKDMYAIEIPKSRISNYLRINQVIDPDIIQFIFDGKLSIKEIEKILPIYDKLKSDNKIEEIYNEINDSKFKASKWLEIYKNEEISKNKKIDTLDLLYQIKNNIINIDDAIEMVQQTRANSVTPRNDK